MHKKSFVLFALVMVLVLGVAPTAYAKKAPPAKPVFVSHPYSKQNVVKAGKNFSTWGYIAPKLSANTTETTTTIYVQLYVGHGSWVATDSLNATATLSSNGKFKKKTNYTATLNFANKGRYRMRAKFVWTDANDVQHIKWSSLKYFWIKK